MREHWAVAPSLTKTKFNQQSRDLMKKRIKWRALRVESIRRRTRWLTGSKTVFPSVLCVARLGTHKYTFDFLSFPNHSTVTVNFLSVNTRKCCSLFRLREWPKREPLYGPQTTINSPLIILWVITWVVWSTFHVITQFCARLSAADSWIRLSAS